MCMAKSRSALLQCIFNKGKIPNMPYVNVSATKNGKA